MREHTYRYDEARELVATAKENDRVISFQRVGAAPYFRFTPYNNNEGVTVNMWSCISMHFEAQPERTLLNYPHIIQPWKEDSWEVNHLTTPWVVSQVAKTARPRVGVLPVEETPFAGKLFQWDHE